MNSRRNFLGYLAAIPVAAATTSFAEVLGSSRAKTANSSGSASETVGRTILSVTLSGPSVSIVDGDDVIVFFPKLEDHEAGVGTSVNETPMGSGDFEVLGLPAPSGPSKAVFSPLRCNAQDPYTQALKLRNFSVRLRRPDVLEGTHPVDVFLSDQATVPADAPLQTFPTALRFIYRGLPRDLSLQISGPNSFLFEPNFDLDQRAGLPFYELKFQYVAGSRRDPCHRDATASFKKLLELFPTPGNVRTIKFGHEDASCSQPASSAAFVHTALSTQRMSGEGFQRPRLLPVLNPSDDCQSIVMGQW